MERESLQDLIQRLKEVSAHVEEVQEKVNSLPRQVGRARAAASLEVLDLGWA